MLDLTPENIAFIGLGVLAATIIALILTRKKNRYPYFSRGALLTKAELKFYNVLKAVTRARYNISCKVRLADIINCNDYHWHKGYGPKISSKHIDFVLTDPETSQILLCIELDDKSHNRPDRIRRDKFVNNALMAADVPLLRVPVTRGYDMAALEKDIVLKL